MYEQVKQIAIRIRELREISGISRRKWRSFQHTFELYQQYEAGEIDIPVSFIYQVANKFNVELTAILTGEEPKLRIYSLVRKGKGLEVERRKEYKYQNRLIILSIKSEPFLVTVDPKPNGEPVSLNSHPGRNLITFLKAPLKLLFNYELILNEGDSLFFDSNYKHGMQALNGKPAKFLAIIL